MVALVRGRGTSGGKPRASTSAKPAQRTVVAKPAAKPRAAGPRTSKLKASAQGGLPPVVAVGAALGAIVICAGVILFTGHRLQAIGDAARTSFYSALGSAGFRMTSFEIAGAAPQARADISRAVGMTHDQPLLGIDLAAIKTRVEQVGWVESASVSRNLPNTLVVRVVERAPVAVWQLDGRMQVIDAKGQVIREADPGAFPQLPLVVGVGANAAGGAVFDLIKARPRLVQRLEALIRVDGRRWDLRLKDGTLIQLPATDEAGAMIRLDQLDQGQKILDLGLQRIDLRTPGMTVVEKRGGAAPATPGAA